MTAIFFAPSTAGGARINPHRMPDVRGIVYAKNNKTFYMFIVIKGLFTGPKEHYMLTCVYVCGC